MLKGRLATPCQIHLNNALTITPKLEILPCDMYLNEPVGKFGKDFISYNEYIELKKSDNYKKIMDSIQMLPSNDCMKCTYLEKCYGGCTVLWKNYSFSALMEYKNNFYKKLSATEKLDSDTVKSRKKRSKHYRQ